MALLPLACCSLHVVIRDEEVIVGAAYATILSWLTATSLLLGGLKLSGHYSGAWIEAAAPVLVRTRVGPRCATSDLHEQAALSLHTVVTLILLVFSIMEDDDFETRMFFGCGLVLSASLLVAVILPAMKADGELGVSWIGALSPAIIVMGCGTPVFALMAVFT